AEEDAEHKRPGLAWIERQCGPSRDQDEHDADDHVVNVDFAGLAASPSTRSGESCVHPREHEGDQERQDDEQRDQTFIAEVDLEVHPLASLVGQKDRRVLGRIFGPRFASLWTRAYDIGPLLDTVIICAAGTILAIRSELWLTHYPQLGGHGLHIAHLLWGG